MDSNFNRASVIDEFSSFIWTEKKSSPGEFQIDLFPSDRWKSLLPDRMIMHSKSSEIMVIEERLETTSQSGEALLKIKGRSMDTILERRSVIPPEGKPVWARNATIKQAILWLFNEFALSSTSLGGASDKLPNLTSYLDVKEAILYDFAIAPQSLYSAIKNLCDSRGYVFGIDYRPEAPNLRFYVREGSERSVYFSTKLDTLAEPSFLHTNRDYYNVAYVWSREGLYRTSVSLGSKTGLNRRVLTVNATDLDVDDETTSTQLIGQMRQRGLEELSKHREEKLFDGKVTDINTYIYGVDYRIGDTVTLIDDYNNTQSVLVSEYIFAQDQEGFRSYPTFSAIET